MIDSVASLAPCGPPDTGASSRSTPTVFSAACIRRTSCGEIVLMSTTRRPAGGAASRPYGPNTISSTCGVSGSIVMTMSASAAAAATLLAGSAPCAESSATASGLTSCAWTGKPALSRFIAIPRPGVEAADILYFVTEADDEIGDFALQWKARMVTANYDLHLVLSDFRPSPELGFGKSSRAALPARRGPQIGQRRFAATLLPISKCLRKTPIMSLATADVPEAHEGRASRRAT